MKQRTKNKILAVVVSVIAIFTPALLFGKWIEAVFFFICHWLIREQFEAQYHHIIPAMCRLITATVFFFGVSFVLPLGFSVFSAIPINYFIGWVGLTKRNADFYEYKYEKLKAQLESQKDFDTDNCTQEELVARCKELGFSAENLRLSIEFFIKKTKHSDIADRFSIEEKSSIMRKLRLKQKLERK
jgi:hypothetical protein